MANFAPPPAEVNTSAAVDPPPEVYSPINNPSSPSPSQQQLQTLALTPSSFKNSITELTDLSDAISAFKQCYDDIHNHIDSIKAAMFSKLPLETLDTTPLPTSTAPPPSLPPSGEKSDEKVSPKQIPEQTNSNIPKSEIEGLCKTMCNRGVRKYLVTHLSDLPKIREEVPKALRMAPNPSKLVLECMGKFFLQGSKAFTRDSPMIPSREASILMLECFLLMIGINGTEGNDNGVVEIDKSVRDEAENAALAWHKRLVVEGGLARAKQVDARGLLLFVACFGIPALFKRDDIRDLVLGADTKNIVGVLKNSQVLMNKIPEIVEGLMKNRMDVDAAEISYTFELQERFNPQTILTSFLKESKESGKKLKKTSQQGSTSMNEGNKIYLAALKSVNKFCQRHSIDPAKFLPGWQISEKILTLQRDIADTDRKASQKRKANEAEASKRSRTEESKRSRYSNHSPQQHNSATGHVDNRRNFSDIRLPQQHNSATGQVDNRRNFSDIRLPNSQPQTVVYGGPGAGLLPESIIQHGISTSHGFSTGSYTRPYGGVSVDASGQFVNRGSQPYIYHGDTALIEKYTGLSKPSIGLSSLYRAPSTVEGFAGVLNNSSVGVSSRSSGGSDLYQFADNVVDKESYSAGVLHHIVGAPSSGPASHHHPSYLYQM